jgi:hypothetical protein
MVRVARQAPADVRFALLRGQRQPGSLRLDARRLDHLAPLLGFACNQLAEVGGRARKHGRTQVGSPRRYLGIDEASIYFFIKCKFTAIELATREQEGIGRGRGATTIQLLIRRYLLGTYGMRDFSISSRIFCEAKRA